MSVSVVWWHPAVTVGIIAKVSSVNRNLTVHSKRLFFDMSDRARQKYSICLSLQLNRRRDVVISLASFLLLHNSPWFSKIQRIKWRKEALFFWTRAQDNRPRRLLFSHLLFCSGSRELERLSMLETSCWVYFLTWLQSSSESLHTDHRPRVWTKYSPWEC